MKNMETRLEELETRTRRIERQLYLWRLIAACLGIGLLCVVPLHPSNAKVQSAMQPASVSNAPFEIRGSNGRTLMRVEEGRPQRLGSATLVGTTLILYSNGVPATALVTGGENYKDAEDANENFLNLLETYQYVYSGGKPSGAELVSTLGLTRAGGSLVLWNRSKKPGDSSQAARLTAKRGSGGNLILFNEEGKETKRIP